MKTAAAIAAHSRGSRAGSGAVEKTFCSDGTNGRYDWGLGAWMWPALLKALPPLPRELEYRLVGNQLVLIDLHADLVVDTLDHALYLEEE